MEKQKRLIKEDEEKKEIPKKKSSEDKTDYHPKINSDKKFKPWKLSGNIKTKNKNRYFIGVKSGK